jgi:tRNA (mo5U34)-methyltransferase
MPDYTPLFAALAGTPLAHWPDALRPLVAAALDPAGHGDLPTWQRLLAELPVLTPSRVDLDQDCLGIGEADELAPGQRQALAEQLMTLHPWRKGPFCLFGVHIDTEWRSDWKWERVRGAVDLRDKRVLDVGCGNGYYGWRMLGAGARLVVGIDPTLRYVMQYAALAHFIGPVANYVLPLRLEQLPTGSGGFDTVFSMGVLYHRRDPLEHLACLKDHLRPGGQVVVESLVVDRPGAVTLRPEGRYAKMKNVWAIPSVASLVGWMRAAGFGEVTTVDVTRTTKEEQRATGWMRFESLADFLDPNDPDRTIEGHPAPCRAVLTARA